MLDGLNISNVKIRSLSKRGLLHKNNCEDAVSFFIKDNFAFIAVFDGCSSGEKSYFASELHAKLFNAAVNSCDIFLTLEQKVLSILSFIRVNLSLMKKVLSLKDVELLSTIIFAVVDLKTKECTTINIGDGLICVDGVLLIVDQNNMPVYLIDYMGMHIRDFYESKCIVKYFPEIKDISISTDGILTYKNFESTEENIIKYFCEDKELENSAAMLGRKYNMLASKGFMHDDDVSIVRLML